MKKATLLFSLLLFTGFAFGQDTVLKNYDHIYQDNIKSVRFHLDGAFLSYPIVDLNSSAQLILSFDDMSEDVNDYIYTLTHCNQDWKPSDLDELDYLDGFNGERLDEYDFSFNTLTEYTHYDLLLPNNDVRWLVSGNYLLNIFEDNGDRNPVLTRRFMVAESTMRIIPDMVIPSITRKSKTHQEIDFVVDFKGVDVRNPQSEITACILQNGRWDNAITGLNPRMVRGTNMIFDYQDKVIFPAGKEFRYADLRTFRVRREKVADIIRMDTYFDGATKELSRTNRNFENYNDINGNFIIEHYEEANADLKGDYAKVLFVAGVNQDLLDTDVYVFGALTDWALKEEFKMAYNPAVGAYVAQAWLKQGYYNYYYVTTPPGKRKNLEEFEGNWHQAENAYTILIYYRDFRFLYDRLVSVKTLSSEDQ